MRFCLIRGLTIPAICLLSIFVSSFSVSAAMWIWFAMIAVDAGDDDPVATSDPGTTHDAFEYQYSTALLFESGGPEDGIMPPMPGCLQKSPVKEDGACWRW